MVSVLGTVLTTRGIYFIFGYLIGPFWCGLEEQILSQRSWPLATGLGGQLASIQHLYLHARLR